LNTTKITRNFIRLHSRPEKDRMWLKTVFGVMLRVARRNKHFTVDDIWDGINRLSAKGSLPDSEIDHRILGPMLRHLVNEGLIDSSGYYAKSTRTGGGSRPVTVWESFVTQRAAA
jgi:hypothetical protein